MKRTWTIIGVADVPQSFEWMRVAKNSLARASALLFGFISFSLLTFPGESLVQLAAWQPLHSVQCTRWYTSNDRDPVTKMSAGHQGELAIF